VVCCITSTGKNGCDPAGAGIEATARFHITATDFWIFVEPLEIKLLIQFGQDFGFNVAKELSESSVKVSGHSAFP
jgi:hypothetical protein